ncbi:hypothetical protein XENORESO_019720 [Xenotaenia resolanae]|uniref:Uncharacterized protein n=1 Tax=Xenotaenia resolanae TaxID=208358 RepID=A0ABV0WPD7_9TELE
MERAFSEKNGLLRESLSFLATMTRRFQGEAFKWYHVKYGSGAIMLRFCFATGAGGALYMMGRIKKMEEDFEMFELYLDSAASLVLLASDPISPGVSSLYNPKEHFCPTKYKITPPFKNACILWLNK